MRPLRVALLGFGKVAESTHLPGFTDPSLERPFEVVAVAEPSPERRRQAASALPKARLHERAEALLASERGLDLACIAAPPFLHAPLVLASLGAGLHAICEKPLSLQPGEVEAIARAASERRRVVYTVNNWRHAPLVAACLDVVRSGKIGEVSLAVWSVERKAADPGAALGGKTWREDPAQALGGILVDHGWHALTFVHALLGPGEGKVRARLETEPGKGDVAARLTIERGKTRAHVRLTWRASRRANRGLVVGERGRLVVDDDRLLGPGEERHDFPEKLSAGSMHPGWFPAVLRAFLDEVSGKTPAGTSLAEARFCAAAIRAAYRSAETGKDVELSG